MNIKRYNRIQMKEIINGIMKEECEVLPIGNHELNRHLVYSVNTNDESYVFKYYYKKEVAENEILALKIVNDIDIPKPRLLDYGYIDGDREWLLMDKVDGYPLFKVFKVIKSNNLKYIYFKMGEYLAKIHKSTCTSSCGYIKDSKAKVKKCSEYFEKLNEEYIVKIKSKGYIKDEVIKKAVDFYYANLELLDSVKEFSFCHNDYDGRNILVRRSEEKWVISAILDYERSMYMDRTSDFCLIHLNNFYFDDTYKEDFYSGYTSILELKKDFDRYLEYYLLVHCLKMYSWSESVAPELFKKSYIIINDIISKI